MIGLFLILILASFAAAAESDGREMTKDELNKRLEENPYYISLIDLRDKKAYDEAHIPYAMNIPLDDLEDTMLEIMYSRFVYMGSEVIVYGDTIEAGEEGAAILEELGFSNVWKLDALEDWAGDMVSTAEESRILGKLHTVDIYGNEVDESILKGYKLIMVNVWATYCAPCYEEMQVLGQLSRDLESKGVRVIGLLSDTEDATLSHVEEKIDLARELARETNASYLHILPSRDLYWRVIGQISAVPTTFFVDETGMQVGFVYVGPRSYEDWLSIVEGTLNGSYGEKDGKWRVTPTP